ncbi:glucosaminidase domain-containing protein [Agitococcus lubricus]|uniref:Mannosyl-glycoprotein endo-beta-N-acetylglucosaminidase n=1 Tax=Agitococcus lubricus TaxID=1077255 RepID=A0A2T5J050_9GAMM|nr:glucosaminidase domain-containing protein [Agitococcus lubricus]PTQ89695.1 mannosyl-glycoprotein endo-beta-N-acetylglucosaminidase [Agitococcus lubricus]
MMLSRCLPIYGILSLLLCGFSPVHSSAATTPQPAIYPLEQAIALYNQQILHQRQRITVIAQRYLNEDDISESDFNWLKKMADDYQLAPQQRGDKLFFETLLSRVDYLPTSVIVAQALMESGLSSYKISNPFGIPCSARCTARLSDALQDYAKRLNTSDEYQTFRQLRLTIRQHGKVSTAQFVNSLNRHPNPISPYHQRLKTIIQHYGLDKPHKS